MPSQVSSRAGIDISSPEKRLLLAVLAEAATALRYTAGARSRAGRRRFAETAAWFASDATDSPFTFASICDILGLDAAYLRSGLRRWQPFAGEAPCPSICLREVDLADPTESVLEAARRMRERRVGTLVIVDDAGKPIGLLTDRDLALRVVAAGGDPRAMSVGEVMTAHPKTASESTPIESALSLMRSGSFRRLPVVNEDGKLVGIVSLDDVLGLLAEEFELIGRLLEREAPHRAAQVSSTRE
jgi:CBS domain-containing protein